MRCQVATYSGHRLHERPLRFTWDGKWLEVRQILEQSYGPGRLRFKVAAADGRRYLLTYDQNGDFWEVEVRGRSG